MLFGEGPKIKNIAADLNKLFRQGSLLNQSGQTVEGDSTADQGTSDLLAARDPVIQEISVGMSGEQSARYTVSGTPPLSLPNSLGKPLKAWEVDVLPKQDLNGYDAPWPAGSGVNKCGFPAVDFTLKGVRYYTVNGTLYVDGTSSGETSSNSADFSALSITLPAGTYYFYRHSFDTPVYLKDSSNTNVVENSGSFTLAEETTLHVGLYVYQKVFSNNEVTLSIVDGSTAPASYSPYSNICPIYGTDKLTITTAGKNLCNALNDIVITNAGNIGNQPCAIHAGTYVYSATSENTAAYQLTVFDANGVQIVSVASPLSYQGRSSLSFTITRNAAYIRCYYNASTIVSDIQVEAGATASDYTPYLAPSQTVLTLPQTVYTGTIGSEGGESEDAVYEFDENLTWQTWGVNNRVQGITGFYFYRSNTPTIDFTNINVAVSTNWLPINYSVWGGSAVGYYTNNTNVNPAVWYEMVGIENSVAGIEDTDTAQQAIDKFKAYLANNPLQVRFSLVTPVQFPITSPTIPTPTGTATTWATAEDGTVDSMEVTYVGKA